MRKLSEYTSFVSEKISCTKLNKNTYVGMDNLLPDKAGITESEYVPTEGMATAFRKGDILLGNIRPYFKKIWLAEFDGGCSPDVLCLRCKADVSPEYIYSVLAQDAFFEYDVKGSKGSKMPRGDKDHIMAFPVMEIDSPKAVGKLICSIHQKIQNNNAIISELESMAKDIYDYWFVQFDFPDASGRPYRSSGGKMVWNEKLKREIPEGWETKPLKDICTVISGYPFSSETYEKSGKYHILTIKNIQDGFVDPRTDSNINQIPSDIPACDILKGGSVLMSLTGNVGRVGILCGEDYLLNQRAALVQPKNKKCKWYLYSFFRSEPVFLKIQHLATGTSQKNVSPKDIGEIMVEYNEKTAEQFSSRVDSIIKAIINCNVENQELSSLRDWLLPMLMNGQVKVGKKIFEYEQTAPYMMAASKDETYLNKTGE